MEKYVLVPDSFKGTLSSSEVCRVMQEEILRQRPAAQVAAIPVADGGEGTVDSFLEALPGRRQTLRVCGPFPGEEVSAFYGLIDDGRTAIVEMAAAAGLPMVQGRADPSRTTTTGVGQLMLDAASNGAEKIIVGIGGSATNDGGCGAAAAAGVCFYDAAGRPFLPTGGTLRDIARIDAGGLSPAFDGVEIVAMCDIDNPMYGPGGAAAVFAPQKGADAAMVEALDAGLRHLAQVIERDMGLRVADVSGAGAAGALGAGLLAFFGATLQMGIETILDTVGFDTVAKDARLVFTGEGRLDTQSLSGKVVAGVARRCKKLGVPAVAVVGGIGEGIDAIYDLGLTSAFSINRTAEDFSTARHHSENNLRLTMRDLMRFYALAASPAL